MNLFVSSDTGSLIQVVPLSKLFVKHRNYNFRTVIKTNRDDTVANTSTNNHCNIIFMVNASIILWEKPLIRRYKPTNERQMELPTMSMTAKSKVDTFVHISGGATEESYTRFQRRNFNLCSDNSGRKIKYPVSIFCKIL